MHKRVFQVFISSPSDVEWERAVAEQAIRDTATRLLRVYGVTLQPVEWHTFAPALTGQPIQKDINAQLEACRIFIGILDSRCGTPIHKKGFGGRTGTEDEFKHAIQQHPGIHILSYFRKHEKNELIPIAEARQRAGVERLKQRLGRAEIIFQEYSSHEEFARRILLDLFEVVLKIITDATTREQLVTFFKFETDHRREDPSVVISYPAIHKHHGTSAVARYNWRERLLPNVVFEDFKAIQKIESALSLLGVRDYKSMTTDSPEMQSPGNRIWLCLPRNHLAQDALKRFEDLAWFRIVGDNSASRRIVWKPAEGKEIVVKSPLSTWLSLRPSHPTRWERRFGDIEASDFAVLARFRRPSNGPAPRNNYYHYFIAGIRGLGTWGAGWYLQGHPEELARLVARQSDEAVQTILHVKYRNSRIQEVLDVGDRDQAYFDEEMRKAESATTRRNRQAAKVG